MDEAAQEIAGLRIALRHRDCDLPRTGLAAPVSSLRAVAEKSVQVARRRDSRFPAPADPSPCKPVRTSKPDRSRPSGRSCPDRACRGTGSGCNRRRPSRLRESARWRRPPRRGASAWLSWYRGWPVGGRGNAAAQHGQGCRVAQHIAEANEHGSGDARSHRDSSLPAPSRSRCRRPAEIPLPTARDQHVAAPCAASARNPPVAN